MSSVQIPGNHSFSACHIYKPTCGDYKGIHAFKYALTKTKRPAFMGSQWPVPCRGVQATSGAKAPGFEALPHLRAVVEQTSGSECIRQLLGAGLREMACTPKEALKAECTEPQFLGIRKFSCGGSK